MWGDPEPTIREQLVTAREKIIKQLDEISFRTHASFARRGGGPPDYSSVKEELEAELREIDALLSVDDDDGP